jgi:hypothetical protein
VSATLIATLIATLFATLIASLIASLNAALIASLIASLIAAQFLWAQGTCRPVGCDRDTRRPCRRARRTDASGVFRCGRHRGRSNRRPSGYRRALLASCGLSRRSRGVLATTQTRRPATPAEAAAPPARATAAPAVPTAPSALATAALATATPAIPTAAADPQHHTLHTSQFTIHRPSRRPCRLDSLG